jgi:hypothetical protein
MTDGWPAAANIVMLPGAAFGADRATSMRRTRGSPEMNAAAEKAGQSLCQPHMPIWPPAKGLIRLETSLRRSRPMTSWLGQNPLQSAAGVLPERGRGSHVSDKAQIFQYVVDDCCRRPRHNRASWRGRTGAAPAEPGCAAACCADPAGPHCIARESTAAAEPGCTTSSAGRSHTASAWATAGFGAGGFRCGSRGRPYQRQPAQRARDYLHGRHAYSCRFVRRSERMQERLVPGRFRRTERLHHREQHRAGRAWPGAASRTAPWLRRAARSATSGLCRAAARLLPAPARLLPAALLLWRLLRRAVLGLAPRLLAALVTAATRTPRSEIQFQDRGTIDAPEARLPPNSRTAASSEIYLFVFVGRMIILTPGRRCPA